MTASIGTTNSATMATRHDWNIRNVKLPTSTSRLPTMLLTDLTTKSSTTSTSPVTRVRTSPVRLESWYASGSRCRCEYMAVRML